MAAGFYGGDWYRGDFWSGEYADGFSVTAPTTIAIRADTDPELPRGISCDLPVNATYHPWNSERVESDTLRFVSFTLKDEMTLEQAFSTTLGPERGDNWRDVDFKKGDRWTYLAYLGEGAFVMEYEGETYFGDQSLWEVSKSSLPDDIDDYHEWLGLTCANGEEGWLFIADIRGVETIERPRVPRYGIAIDLDAPEPPESE